MRNCLAILLAAIFFGSCSTTTEADLLLFNGKIYTVDSAFSTVEAVAVKDGKIIATGTSEELKKQFQANEQIDLNGKYLFPGFIDAHAHFYRYGLGLRECDLVGSNSWSEILQRLDAYAKSIPAGEWIIGRGWDQNDWDIKEFPLNDSLNIRFPNNPVILTRVDGHAAIVNDYALEKAGITASTKLVGGDVFVQNGKPTGVLIDNAIDLVGKIIPNANAAQAKEALLKAQQNCFAAGLTSIDDCGLDFEQVEHIEQAYKGGDLKMRLYVMLSDARKNYDYIFKRGMIKTERLNVRSFKVYADGALGSRGACLLQPYSDRANHHGFLLSDPAHFDSVAAVLYANKYQMCTHAIGDSGNRTILNIYGKYLKEKNDLRWRIEHAQVVNAKDFNLFGMYSIV
ncbi:MAG: amidohydrolase, partial [Chitinophagaceae bacterium]